MRSAITTFDALWETIRWPLLVAQAFILVFASGSTPASHHLTPATRSACNQASKEPIALLDLPGFPFEPIPTPDGCWIFVSLTSASDGAHPGIAVLRRLEGTVKMVRLISMPPGAAGMVLTHDGRVLIVALNEYVIFMRTEALISPNENPIIGRISDGYGAGVNYVNVTADDKFLFVSNEHRDSITVIDLEKARNHGFMESSVVGTIPTGHAPIALSFSLDGRYLYNTNEAASESWHWPVDCNRSDDDYNVNKTRPEGAIVVIDVPRAETDPAHSVLTRIPAGCSPVRLQLSPEGNTAYVTARGDNTLLIFDTRKLLTDPRNARVATVPVGLAPVGIAVVNQGSIVVIANSNRFRTTPSEKQTLTLIETASISTTHAASVGSLPAGSFPRELRVTADGHTLLLTNFESRSLEVIDLERLPMHVDKNFDVR
jgi:YVTN family beta-propeller protein